MTELIGLTGSIATGKSTIARMFVREGAAVFDADECVHSLMQPGGVAQAEVLQQFPQCKTGEKINRGILGSVVFSDQEAMLLLEAILHPYVFLAMERAIRQAEKERRKAIICDIPLLFETMDARIFDAIAVTISPEFLQRQRAFARTGMDETRFISVLERQMPQTEKIRHADVIIHTGMGKAHSLHSVRRLLRVNSG